MARARRLPDQIRQGVISHIVRYDLLRRQEFRDAFLARIPLSEFQELAGKRSHTLWDVIVAGAEAYLANQPTTTSYFHLTIGISRTTVGRCIKILEQLGIIRLHADEADQRRTVVEFSEPFQEILDRYVNECFEEFEELITTHHDHERHKAETALHNSEERYRALVELAADAILIVTDDIFVFANSAAVKLVGAEQPEQLIGRNLEDFIHPDFIESAAQDRQRMMHEHYWIQRGERRALKLDGSVLDVEIAASYLRWDGVDSIQLIIRDISDRKIFDQALKESEANFRDLIDGSVQGVLIHRNHKPIYVNDAFANTHGYTVAKILEMDSNLPLIAPEERKRLQAFTLDRVTNENVPNHYLYKGLRNDGNEVWLDNVVRIVDWHGENAIQSTVIDISSQKMAEEALRESEARWRSLTKESPDYVILLDADLNIQFINHAILGLTREQLIGTSVSAYHQADETERIMGILEAVLSFGDPSSYESSIEFLDGKTVYYHSRVVARWIDNAVIGLTIHARDITARKALEQELAKAQRAEGIAQLTSGMAHEFNNILATIIGNLGLIEDGGRIEDKFDKNSIGIALKAAFRGAALTDRLLAFSRQQPLNASATQINEILPLFCLLAESVLGEDIAIELKLTADLWQTTIDVGQLENALMNLAINARDAMPDGGRLTIETSNQILAEDKAATYEDLVPGDYAMIAISDSGTGMSAESLERALEPFFTTKSVGEGSGLGLSMVFGFTRQSGGQVSIESEAGVGTTARLFLPRAESDGGVGHAG